MSEIGKIKDERTQSITKMIELFDKLGEKKKSQEKQMSGWRSFARHVEQFAVKLKLVQDLPFL